MSAITDAVIPATVREVHLRDYWRIIWKGRWTVAGVFLLVVAATAAYSFLKTPVYRATATVEVQPQARRLGPGQDVSGLGVTGYGWFAEEKYQNTQIEIIRSRAIAERAFATLGLASDSRFAEARDPVGVFQGMVKVEPRRETGLIDISILGPDREEITRWVNVVADTYVERNIERARENARNAVAQIKQMMAPLSVNLTEAEGRRLDVLKETQIYNPENQAQIVRQRLEKLNAEKAQAQIEVARLGALLNKIEQLQANSADPMTVPELAEDKVLQDLNQQKVLVERQIESTRVTYRPGAPAYQEKVQELEKIKARIRDQIAQNLGNIRNRYDLARSNQAVLERDIRTAEEESLSLGVAASQYQMVKTDAETKQQLYQAITKTMNEVSISAELLSNNVSLVDHAIPPLRPVQPNKRLNLVLGAMFGVFLGISTVFFLDYLDNTLRTPEDIEHYLQLTTLSVIPKFSDAERGSNAVKEAYQSLRMSLIFSSKNRERRIILVTSTGPQEGKSSTVAHLARTLAGAGDRVLVLDCDLRRPTQHVQLGIERDRGLTNYLVAPRGQDEWLPFVKSVGPANLHAITCGPIPPNPPELLGSERFRRLLAEARAAYDWVIVDSPPALSLADAVLLSSLTDVSVLVVRHNVTDRDHVMRTVHAFRKVGSNLIGAILNNVDLDRAHKSDYYYAGYYYDDAKDAEAKASPGRPAAPRREKDTAGTGV